MRLLFGIGIFLVSLHGVASQLGPNGPSSATTSGSTSYNWSNASNVLTDNSSAATATIVGANNTTNVLRLTNFGFSIPSGTVINGILMQVRMQGTNGKSRDQTIQLRKAAGAVGNNKARSKSNWPKNAAKEVRFGGSSDLWGTTWTFSDINNSAFGIDIAAKCRRGTAVARVEYVSITVFYDQSLYYSKSTGNLHTLATWGTNTDGTGTAPSNFTTDGQVFNLRNRTTATLTANLTISGNGSKLVCGNGSTAINFTIPAGFSYLGLIDVSNNATLTINNTTVPNFGTIARTSNGGISTVIFGAAGAQAVEGRAFHNLTLSGGTKALNGAASAEEKLTISSGTIFDDGGYTFAVEKNVENSGTHQSVTGGMLLVDGSASQSITGTSGIFGNLEIDNSNGVNLSTSVNVSGVLTLTDGAFSIASNTLTLSGTVSSIGGTLTGGSSANVIINGSGDFGTLNFTSGAQSLNNLTVNRTSATIYIGTALNVRSTLTMTTGNIAVGSNVLTLGISTASRGTLSRTNGTIVGYFSRWFANATNSGVSGLFPIGTESNYRPVQIEFTSAPSTGGRLTAIFEEGDPGNSGLPLSESGVDINKAGVSGIWSIVATTLVGGTYSGTFTAEGFIGVEDYATLHLLRRSNSGANWTLSGTHVTTTGSNATPVLRRTGMSAFGEFGVGGDAAVNPLPVELLFFNASQQDDRVDFHWATAQELNNDYFHLEQSIDGTNWE